MIKDKSRKKIILNILSSIGLDGGVPNKVMEIYRNIDRNKYQFHFFVYTHEDPDKTFESEIVSLGGKVFYYGSIRDVGIIKFNLNFAKHLRTYKYDTIHSYNGLNDGFLLLIARCLKIRKRIAHSRGAEVNSKIKKILLPLLRKLIIKNSNIFLAASKKSGDFLFGDHDYTIVPNPFDINKFIEHIDSSEQADIKRELNISEQEIIIGHVGRFSKEKNHLFLIEIAKRLKELNYSFKLIMIGEGSLKAEIENKIIELNLENYVSTIGNKKNIQDYYTLFDVLLFPSLHEGFGNVAVESQMSGVRVIASEGVSKEVDLELNLIKFITNNNLELWITEINEILNTNLSVSNEKIMDAVDNKGFSLNKTIEHYMQIYS